MTTSSETAEAKSHEMLRVQRDGADVVELALAWMDERGDEPFLAWLHFYDPHYPYEPPGEFAERYADRPYDGEIAYTDQLLGRVLDYLREQGLYDSTLDRGDRRPRRGPGRAPRNRTTAFSSTTPRCMCH